MAQHDMDSDELRDAAMIRQGYEKVEAEIAAEDAIADVTPEQELELFTGRLQAWLNKQPDVADVELVAGGGDEQVILGFQLAGAGPISLSYNITP